MQVEPNVVITEFIINMDNVYHNFDNTNLDVAKQVSEQTESLAKFNVPFYVLTNSPDQVKDDGNFHIVNVDLFQHYPGLTIFFHRLLMAFDFLQAHPEIEKAVITDASDVTMLNYPFDNMKDGTLYMCDQWDIMGDSDVLSYNDSPRFIKKFIAENQLLPTVNMGIIAGSRSILIEYLRIIFKIIAESSLKVQQGDATAGLGKYDMEIGNYVAYRYFSDRLIHGREINTFFQGFQTVSSSWMKHK